MRGKLFKSIFTLSISVFVLCLIFILSAVYRSFTAAHLANLKTQTEYLSALVNKNGIGILEGAEAEEGMRITVIQKDGTVLYDSAVSPETLDDHSKRDEVAQAFENGAGESVRWSDTLSGRTCYYAILLNSGDVLRISVTEFKLSSLIIELFSPIVAVILLAIFLSVFFAARLSRTVTEPINNINLANPDERDVYDELKPFVRRINKQNRQLYDQMEQLKEEHKKQDKLRREFTANVSHELKTPLTSISGYAEIMRDGLVKSEDIPTFSGRIYDEAQRLIALVGDIIELSQLEDRDTELKFEQVDIKAICEDTAKRLTPLAQRRNITLNVNANDCVICACRPIIEEIVFNLCDNAVKYNKEGGRVDIILKDKALTVKDTGIGIAKSELERVFERFYRVDKSHSKAIGGTGLGLSIVKHGVNAHNARIEIESRVNEGTQITVYFG